MTIQQDMDLLITDDDPDDRELLISLLKAKGYKSRISEFSDGGNLINYLLTNKAGLPSLVLLDLNMPGKDGFAVLKEIREYPFSLVKVVILTGSKRAGDKERCLALGCDGYLVKPQDYSEFKDLADAIMRFARH